MASNQSPFRDFKRGAPVATPTPPAAQSPTPRPYLPLLLAGMPNRGVQSQYNPAQAQSVFGAAAAQQPSLSSAYGPAAAFMWPMQAVNAISSAYNQMEQAGQLPRQQAGYAQGNGYPGNADVPYGVDPRWWQQFTAEHDGRTPERVYQRDGEYAVAHALADKAWGDQFYRTYGRPPSDYDWKASYSQRQRAFYG